MKQYRREKTKEFPQKTTRRIHYEIRTPLNVSLNEGVFLSDETNCEIFLIIQRYFKVMFNCVF